MVYLKEEVTGELLDGEHIGDDGVWAELVERDGADDALCRQDGAADQQHVRLLLAQRVHAPAVRGRLQEDRQTNRRTQQESSMVT
jgi:hypothetical protein